MEEAEDEPLFCERAAGIDIGKQTVMVTVRVPSETRREAGRRRPGSSAPRACSCWNWRTGCGPGRGAGRDGKHQRLLEAGVLPAGAAGLRLRAVPGVQGQGAARAAEDRASLDSAWLAKVTERGSVAGRSCRRRTSAGCAPIPLPQAADPGEARKQARSPPASGTPGRWRRWPEA